MTLAQITAMTALLSAVGMILAMMHGLSRAPQWHRVPLGVAAIGILIYASFLLQNNLDSPWFVSALLVEHLGFIALGVLQFLRR